jgi:hypothetical protein
MIELLPQQMLLLLLLQLMTLILTRCLSVSVRQNDVNGDSLDNIEYSTEVTVGNVRPAI